MIPSTNFADKVASAMLSKNSRLCVGFDPEPEKIPRFLLRQAAKKYTNKNEMMASAMREFLLPVMSAVAEFCAVVKPQSAFYERYGSHGIALLEDVFNHAKSLNLPIILDAKRGDGGPTAEAYADTYLGTVPYWNNNTEEFVRAEGPLRVDALTVQPGIGDACLVPFVRRSKEFGTGTIVVTKSSFTPNSAVELLETQNGIPVWQEIAQMVAKLSEGTEGASGFSSVAVVMGATYPEDTPIMRKILEHAWFLVPGYGAQGGGADGAVVGMDPRGLGCIVNSSRGILYAYSDEKSPHKDEEENFATAAARAAQAARDDLNAALKRAGKIL